MSTEDEEYDEWLELKREEARMEARYDAAQEDAEEAPEDRYWRETKQELEKQFFPGRFY